MNFHKITFVTRTWTKKQNITNSPESSLRSHVLPWSCCHGPAIVPNSFSVVLSVSELYVQPYSVNPLGLLAQYYVCEIHLYIACRCSLFISRCIVTYIRRYLPVIHYIANGPMGCFRFWKLLWTFFPCLLVSHACISAGCTRTVVKVVFKDFLACLF